MSLIEELNLLVSKAYTDEDGEEVHPTLLPPLNEYEMEKFVRTLPEDHLPEEVRELLSTASGIKISDYGEDLRFYGYPHNHEWFPLSITLQEDGAGNFWFIALDEAGNWLSVYFFEHETMSIIKCAEDLEGFIRDLRLSMENPGKDHYTLVSEKLVWELARRPDSHISKAEALAQGDETLRLFVSPLPDNYVIGDLRGKSVDDGISLGHCTTIIPHPTELIWAGEPKVSFWKRLFKK